MIAMKRVILVCIFLMGYLTYAQQGYRYGSEYINLEAENTMFFVQTKNAESDKSLINVMTVRQQQKRLKSFSKISNNRYLVISDERIVNTTDYFSDVYKSSNQNQVIVLPDGGSGLPFSSELPNGWSVRFSASPMYNVNKEHIEFGIEPDIYVSMTENDKSNGKDTIIEKARELIHSASKE